MIAARPHRIARQTVELRVADASAARQIYSELSASLVSRMAATLEDVFTSACPPSVTIRLERIEVDAGVVAEEQLVDAIVEATRTQLKAQLEWTIGAAASSAGFIEREQGGSTERSAEASRLTEDDLVLERAAMLLEHGFVTWRETELGSDALETTLAWLMDCDSPGLRSLLQRVPADRAAARIWGQLTVAARHRLLRWLGAGNPADLDVAIAEWAAVLAEVGRLESASESLVSSFELARIRRGPRTWMLMQTWALVVSGALRREPGMAISDRVLAMLFPETETAAGRALLSAMNEGAGRVIDRNGIVACAIAGYATRANVASAHNRGIAPAGSINVPADAAPSRVEKPARLTASSADDAGETAGFCDAASGQAIHLPPRAPLAQTRSRPGPTTEPLWAAHAGVAIAWPFLEGLFAACGLTAAKQFVDEKARARAAALIAYLATGLFEWGEHDLLVEKVLCGCAPDEPIPAAIDLSDREGAETSDLLESIVHHWSVLQSTSPAGLRAAFLQRPGTLTAIASGWKLEVPRAGADVLLDSLPWGMGVVLLPWMPQPLHVEW